MVIHGKKEARRPTANLSTSRWRALWKGWEGREGEAGQGEGMGRWYASLRVLSLYLPWIIRTFSRPIQMNNWFSSSPTAHPVAPGPLRMTITRRKIQIFRMKYSIRARWEGWTWRLRPVGTIWLIVPCEISGITWKNSSPMNLLICQKSFNVFLASKVIPFDCLTLCFERLGQACDERLNM